ncbi:hypothetical protein K435DRAFT_854114 [Dendrothele bispora CBS 962.96]|uniref:Uncharacterized protein n=1 Tax=Dendrothele bispora (strain CBS 962.96) TaxID=1314807 RepID=A0A4V4HH34_DENBC|nr:hypothetical protein K435DRAFT_854114 [Dendrothele bispora CBS 962.96]
MPSTTSDSWAKQLSDLATNFEKCCGAAALFFWSVHSATGLRLEAPSIMYEFVDNFNFGHDPEGVLFFHNKSDFNSPEKVSYKIVYNRAATPAVVRVDFYGEDDDYKAGFITNDTANMDTYLDCNVKDGIGKFSPYHGAVTYGHLHKNTTSTQTRLMLDPIGRQATWTNDKKESIDTIGSFYFNAMSDFVAGTANVVADYNKERVAFYQKIGSDDEKFIGVFYPNIALPAGDDNHAKPVTATWKDI